MDHLEQFKQNWNSQSTDLPHYTENQLRGFIHKKSSNNVKWLLIIAVIEFAIMMGFNFLPFISSQTEKAIEITGETFHYLNLFFWHGILAYFIYLFYRNYKRISAVQSIKELIHNIIRTRKTMRWYIWFNLIYVFVFGLIFCVMMLLRDPVLQEQLQIKQQHSWIIELTFIGVSMIVLLLICGAMYVFYSLIYGILMSRLKKNHQELEELL